jgi:glycosyltransferase involved in cell wall biosynthesis
MEYVVIPAYNEGSRVGNVIKDVKRYSDNIVVVDDGSSDDTSTKAEVHGAIVVRHRVNLGKGAALKSGCDFAVRNGATKIVVLDADGQHEPKHIPKLINALEEYDLVYSYRKASGEQPFVLKFGNGFINNCLAVVHGVKVEDSQCGYRAFTAAAYRKVRWRAHDYYMETEMIINARKQKMNHTELPINTIYGDKYKGTTVLDGVKIVSKILSSKVIA